MKRFSAVLMIAVLVSACETIDWDGSTDVDPYRHCRDQADRYPGAYEDCIREHESRSE